MVEFGRNNIPSYNHTDGFGYHEFTSDQYISSDKKILLMNKVSIYNNTWLLIIVVLILEW